MWEALAAWTLTSYAGFLGVRSQARHLHQLALDSVAVLDLMLAEMPESDKLPMLESATGRLIQSLLRGLTLLAVGTVVVCAPLGLEALGWLEPAPTWGVMLAISVGGSLAFFVPRSMTRRDAAAAHRAPLDQLLHRLILDHPHLHLRLMRREIAQWRRNGGQPQSEFLWITGLARAGTTSMLERLTDTGAFASLHYGLMPMVLAPGTWQRFHKSRDGEKRERSHGDGIFIGSNSPEALEEVFFRAITNSEYITSEALRAHEISEEMHRTYLDYQGLVRAANGKSKGIYLAKNNNALLRYPAMRRHNLDFHAIVLFREPLAHAASLLAMHEKYCQMQHEDPFVREYMDWLAHHEFGLGQLPFAFEAEDLSAADEPQDTDNQPLDPWLRLWVRHYQAALRFDPHRLHFVDYAEYCAAPREVLEAVLATAQISAQIPNLPAHNATRKVDVQASPALLAEAHRVHDQLRARRLKNPTSGD